MAQNKSKNKMKNNAKQKDHKSLAKAQSKSAPKPEARFSQKNSHKSEGKASAGKNQSSKHAMVKVAAKGGAKGNIHGSPQDKKTAQTKQKIIVKGKPDLKLQVRSQKQPNKIESKEATKTESNKAAFGKKSEIKKGDQKNLDLKKSDKTAAGKSTEKNILVEKVVKSEEKAGSDKSAKSKNQKTKKEEVDLADDFIPDDDLGSDEIGEYEEELKAVETLDSEEEEVDDWNLETKSDSEDEIVLTDAEGNRYCRAKDCDQISAVDIYCRYHYLLFWKKIQIRKKILADGKLERYVEELTARYPDKFLEMIRRDLRTQKDFLSAIQELEIDESGLDNDFEEDTQSFIDEVRGLGDSPGLDEEEF